MFMLAVARRWYGAGGGGGGHCTDTARDSALEVDSGRKIPCHFRGPRPASGLHQTFQSDTLPAELPPPSKVLTGSGKRTIMYIYHALINALSAQRCLCRMKGTSYRVNAKIIYNILLKQVCSCLILSWCEYAFLWLDKTGSKMAVDKTGSKMAVQLWTKFLFSQHLGSDIPRRSGDSLSTADSEKVEKELTLFHHL